MQFLKFPNTYRQHSLLFHKHTLYIQNLLHHPSTRNKHHDLHTTPQRIDFLHVHLLSQLQLIQIIVISIICGCMLFTPFHGPICRYFGSSVRGHYIRRALWLYVCAIATNTHAMVAASSAVRGREPPRGMRISLWCFGNTYATGHGVGGARIA